MLKQNLQNKPQITVQDLEVIHLSSGSHQSRNDGVCAMEAAAWLAGRAHTDHPVCVSPTIGKFMRTWNDDLKSDEERDRLLKPLLPVILQTVSTEEMENQRSWLATDWLARIFIPSFLEHVPKLMLHAEALRKLEPFTEKTWTKNWPTISAAWDAARDAAGVAAWDAAGDAAWDAARAAAGDAARAAAGVAAWVAAGDAAWAAARAAARDAAGAAAGAAAGDKLAPIVATLQESAQELVRSMALLDMKP